MKYLFLTLAMIAQPLPAIAGESCDVPVAEWQPREALREKLEHMGWQVDSIVAVDGCYLAIAVDQSGHQVTAAFNPKTLIRTSDPNPVGKS